MRFISALVNDIRYQMKYGFYFLYAFISALYIAVLLVCPIEYKKVVASIIILTDPAMLGMFFIGGIWLLEKEEGLHGFWGISPLRPMEYILSKAVSLAIISTLSANVIALIGFKEMKHYFVLSISVFLGSLVFTTIGLIVATYARSVNHYIIIASPSAILLSTPPILLAFGISHPIFDVLPGTELWHMLSYSIGMTDKMEIGLWIMLAVWLGVSLLFANKRIPIAMQLQGGEKT